MPKVSASSNEILADLIELNASLTRSGSVAYSRLIFLLGEQCDRISEENLEIALEVMRARQRTLGSTYPFCVGEFAVRRHDSSYSDIYQTLLHLTSMSAARQLIPSRILGDISIVFEEVVEIAMQGFWGANGRAISFAFPSRHGRPKEFDRAVPWLAKQMDIEVGTGYRPPRRKDGGVDVVAWRPFSDRRPGFPVALVQCTVQQEKFTKTTDIDLRLWASWLALDADPLSLLAFPGTVRNAGPEWRQLSTVVMPIDRLRLMEMIASVPQQHVALDWTRRINEYLLKNFPGVDDDN